MKIRTFLKEMAQIERTGNSATIEKSKSPIAFDKMLEDKLVSSINRAIEGNEELQKMFSMNQPPYDVEVSKVGSNVKITTNPENGQPSKTALFSLMSVQKYLTNPKGLASLLLTGYKR